MYSGRQTGIQGSDGLKKKLLQMSLNTGSVYHFDIPLRQSNSRIKICST